MGIKIIRGITECILLYNGKEDGYRFNIPTKVRTFSGVVNLTDKEFEVKKGDVIFDFYGNSYIVVGEAGLNQIYVKEAFYVNGK